MEGRTPVIKFNYRHDRISAVAALTTSAVRRHVGLYAGFRGKNFDAPAAAGFIGALLRHLAGEVILLWDQAPIHKGPFIRELGRRFPRLHVEYFPGYAPDLNPVENVWHDFKSHDANSVLVDTRQVRSRLHANVRRARRLQAKLRSFILASDLPSPLA